MKLNAKHCPSALLPHDLQLQGWAALKCLSSVYFVHATVHTRLLSCMDASECYTKGSSFLRAVCLVVVPLPSSVFPTPAFEVLHASGGQST